MQLETALALSPVLGPRAVVNAAREGVDAGAVLLVVDPLAVVVFVFVVSVPALAVLHPVLPAALVDRLLAVQAEQDSVAVLFALQELALVPQVLRFEGVKALAVVDARKERAFVLVAVGKVDDLVGLEFVGS